MGLQSVIFCREYNYFVLHNLFTNNIIQVCLEPNVRVQVSIILQWAYLPLD